VSYEEVSHVTMQGEAHDTVGKVVNIKVSHVTMKVRHVTRLYRCEAHDKVGKVVNIKVSHVTRVRHVT
jgi:hypothetical protein